LAGPGAHAVSKVPPHAWFIVNAIFHYVGPSFAVLLFPVIGVFGVAWLRIAAGAIILAPITLPWRVLAKADRGEWILLFLFGVSLGAMNFCFYLALEHLPLSLVAAMEFIGPLAIALAGSRTIQNVAALGFAIPGVCLVLNLRWMQDATGLLWAGANAALFVFYILLGHRMAREGASSGIGRLGAGTLIAAVVTAPIGATEALATVGRPSLLLAGLGVGLASSVIPYVCDQLAMARLSRESFVILLSLLPASAAVVGAIVLHQLPTFMNALGIAMVMIGLAIHRPATRHRAVVGAAATETRSRLSNRHIVRP